MRDRRCPQTLLTSNDVPPMAAVQHGPAIHGRPAAPASRKRNERHALAPWRPVKLLGEGTLARVYAARHASSRASAGAAYAVKVLRPRWYEHADVLEILRQEAFVGSRVRHPNVVTVLDARLSDPPYYVVMPRLVGRTLEEVLAARPGGLPPLEALWIARQMAEGLGAIQAECGATHGDVKPSNVFLSDQGRVTLLDLGFARIPSESPDSSSAAVSRSTLCSLAYAAPETLQSSLAADNRSDIYSLGVVLYRMLSGRLPHEAPDPGLLVEQLRTGRPICIRQLHPELSKSIASLVHRMLSREPLRRPQSYAELTSELVRLEIDSFADRATRTHGTPAGEPARLRGRQAHSLA